MNDINLNSINHDTISKDQTSIIPVKYFQHFFALTAIITYYLCLISHKFSSFSIFLPLLALELIEIFIFKNLPTSTSIIELILMFAGFSLSQSKIVMRAFNIISHIFKNIAIYLFFFINCHLVTTIYLQNTIIKH